MSSEASAYPSNALSSLAELDLSSSSTSLTGSKPLSLAVNVNETQEQSNEDLLCHVSDGNREALSHLFRRHGRTVYNVARRILKDDAEAEDLVQELFLYIFQKAATFDAQKTSGSSWIIQMAYHRSIDRRRYLGVRQHYQPQDHDIELLRSKHESISINELAAKGLLSKFRTDLSFDQQLILELHFFEGYSFQEIAEKTGQTLGNIRNHYYRGLERLRSYIFPGKTPPK